MNAHPFARLQAHPSVWNRPSVWVLILTHLLPLLGVLFWGWEVFPLVFLFWFENVVLGALNVLKILLCRGSAEFQAGQRIGIAAFFAVHYGIFTLVHGVFVMVLFGQNSSLAHSPQLLWAMAALAGSHTFSFVSNYLIGGERHNVSPATLMAQPYTRIVALHITILLGGFVLVILGSPAAGLLVLLGIKLAMDIRAHVRERERAAVPGGFPGVPTTTETDPVVLTPPGPGPVPPAGTGTPPP